MSTPSTERDPSAGMQEDAAGQMKLGLDDDAGSNAPEAQAEPAPSADPGEVRAGGDDATGHLFEHAQPRAATIPALTLGARLRNAREAMGLGLDQASRALRIPTARLAEIERDHFDAIGAPVYLRGYLRSYARLVGLPEVVVTAALEGATVAPPALVATQTVSRSHYFTSRYGSLVVYGVLTAVFVVPLLWAARQGALLPEARAPLASLDAGSVETVSTPASVPLATSAPQDMQASDDFVGPPAPESVAEVSAAPEPPRPVMAAMAPMPARVTQDPVPAAGIRRVTLSLMQESWVEVLRGDGTRVEYGLVPGGTERSYDLAGGGSLRIGNTRGATLSIDGERVDLAPYTRANVARIAIPENPARND